MRAREFITETWSKKYKKSINCSNPKGFSQRAHCAGRKARRAGKKTKSGSVSENFADGKKPGRKGLAKRSGVNCKQSVTKLRSVAKNSTGEKRRMAHWCANMKSGRKKSNESKDYFKGSKFKDDDGNSFSVEKVVAFAKKNSKYLKKNFPLSKIKHDLSWWQGNEERMMDADTSYPLLVIQNDDGHLSVADGLNRMKKAISVEKKKTIDVYLVPKKDILHLTQKKK